MMRNLLFALLCTCALSSCSKEETLPPEQALQGGLWAFLYTDQFIYETTHGELLVRRQLDWEKAKIQTKLSEMRFCTNKVIVSYYSYDKLVQEERSFLILNNRLYMPVDYYQSDWGELTIDGDRMILKTKWTKAPDFSRNDIIVHNYAVYTHIYE